MKRLVILIILIWIPLMAFALYVRYRTYLLADMYTYNPKYNIVAMHDFNADDFWSLVQSWRVRNNLKPYTKDQRLCNSAAIRVKEIKIDFSHDGFIGSRFCYNCHIAENLIGNYPTEALALKGWINSPDHLENLQYNYKYSCIAVDGNYAVQHFANYY